MLEYLRSAKIRQKAGTAVENGIQAIALFYLRDAVIYDRKNNNWDKSGRNSIDKRTDRFLF